MAMVVNKVMCMIWLLRLRACAVAVVADILMVHMMHGMVPSIAQYVFHTGSCT